MNECTHHHNGRTVWRFCLHVGERFVVAEEDCPGDYPGIVRCTDGKRGAVGTSFKPPHDMASFEEQARDLLGLENGHAGNPRELAALLAPYLAEALEARR